MNAILVMFAAGLSIGILGSLHCIGMCGPLALAVPIRSTHFSTRLIAAIVYNTGKALTYVLLGILVGIIGNLIRLTSYQQIFSIVAGSILLLGLLLGSFIKINIIPKPLGNITGKLMAKLLKTEPGWAQYLAMGAVNGLLPCGLVYSTLLIALATGSVTGSIATMLGFGIGNYPVLAIIMLMGPALPPLFRLRISKMSSYVIAISAVLLILRGSNIGIPYISPSFKSHNPSHNCCHK